MGASQQNVKTVVAKAVFTRLENPNSTERNPQDASCPLDQAANNSCECDLTQSSQFSEDVTRCVLGFSLVTL